MITKSPGLSRQTEVAADGWTSYGRYIINERDMFMFATGAMCMCSSDQDFAFWEFVSIGCSYLNE